MAHCTKWLHYHINSSLICFLFLIAPIAAIAQEEFSNNIPFDSMRDSSLRQGIMNNPGFDETGKSYVINNPKNEKNPLLASVMSAIVPGTGQIYSGRIKEGINSIVLLGGLTAFCFAAPEIIVLTAPTLSRYYWGGIYHANLYARCTDTYNTKMDSSTIKDLSPLLKIPYIAYKKFFSSQDLNVCSFEPSCSNYMMKTIKENGLLTGILDGTDRLLRCHPLASSKDYKYDWNCQKYIDESFNLDLSNRRNKNPYLSAVLSGIIPGSGKIYTNHIIDGLYSFVVCSAFSYLTYNSVKKHGFNYSTIIYGTLSLSFYSANIYGSYKSAFLCR